METNEQLACVVPVSGGKDSQACLSLAVERFGANRVRGLFCDTQFEHPETYKHIDWMAEHYGVRIDTITAGSVLEKVRKYRRFPGGGARHCTEELKIIPTKKYLSALADELGHGVEVWYGMRSDESSERAKRYRGIGSELYAPHEIMPRKYPQYLAKKGVMFRLPILDWSRYDVLTYLHGKENPLYAAGFDRVGCFPCLAAGDAHKARAFAYDEVGRRHRLIVTDLEGEIGKSVWTSKGGAMRNNPDQQDMFSGCGICAI